MRIKEGLGRFLPTVAPGPLAPGGAQAQTLRRVIDQFFKCSRELGRAIRWNEEPSHPVDHGLGDPADIMRHHGKAMRSRLDLLMETGIKSILPVIVATVVSFAASLTAALLLL